MIRILISYAQTPYTAGKLACFVLVLACFVLLPSLARKMAGKISHGWLGHIAGIQSKFMLALDFFFALHILSMGVMLFMMSICSFKMIAPGVLAPLSGYPIDYAEHLDDPLTARMALFWVIQICVPMFCFKHIALPSLRDTHQVMTGQRDRLRHLKSGGTLKGQGSNAPSGRPK